MTIKEAVEILAQFVRDSGKPLSEAVRDAWPQLDNFSDEDSQTLIQEGLCARTNPTLRDVFRVETSSSSNRVSVRIAPYTHAAMERHEVTCTVLSDIFYNVNGQSKCVAKFTRFDVLTRLERVRLVEAGVVRHRQAWEYVLDRLTKCQKSTVGDLGAGDQDRIARIFYDLKQGEETELLALK